MSTSTRITPGTERLISCADIKPQAYPLSLELSKEEFMNSKRHGASKVDVTFRENEKTSYYEIEYRCNSTGDANRERLLSPSALNGGGTSRYAAGLPVARLKRGNPGDAFQVLWKKTGEPWYYEINNTEDGTVPKRLDMAGSPWSSDTEHGFVHRCVLRKETLEKFGDAAGVKIDGIVPAIREICCVGMMPETLESLDITVTVFKQDGSMVDTSNSKKQKWMPFETALMQVNDRVKINQTVSHPATLQLTAKTRYLRVVVPRNTSLPGFPRYGVTKTSWAFIGADGFYTAIPTKDALDRSLHGASLNGRLMFTVLTSTGGVESYPTPASTKNGFLGTCPIYRKVLKAINDGKPTGYGVYTPTDTEPAVSPVEQPTKRTRTAPGADEQWHATQHGRSIIDEVERKEGETEDKYIKRVKANRSSRKSKQKRGSPPASPASVSSTVTEDNSSVEVPTTAVDANMVWWLANEARIQECMAREDIRARTAAWPMPAPRLNL